VSGKKEEVMRRLSHGHLHTVCQEAKCPNRAECFCRGCATFLVLGTVCTRNCAFCSVTSGAPAAVDPDEPQRLVKTVAELHLHHAVITSVTRDDLPDGGAAHFATIVSRMKQELPGVTVEVLVPDFQGDHAAVETVLHSGCDIFNHNVETVPRLYARIRPHARFSRSLDVLSHAARHLGRHRVKSGIMVGLGERREEVIDLLTRLYAAGCDIVTIGQYLQPASDQLPVQEFIAPDIFAYYRDNAKKIGFSYVYAAPFVRSSYKADEAAHAVMTDTTYSHSPVS
jgi:lipoic acid synthetase